jgi:hypothetical protein
MAKEAAEAQRLGGLRSRRELGVGGAYGFTGMRSLDDLHRVLDIATFDTLALENSIGRNRALAGFVMIGAKLLEVGDHEERIETLEHALSTNVAESQRVFDLDAEDGDYRFVDLNPLSPEPEPDEELPA